MPRSGRGPRRRSRWWRGIVGVRVLEDALVEQHLCGGVAGRLVAQGCERPVRLGAAALAERYDLPVDAVRVVDQHRRPQQAGLEVDEQSDRRLSGDEAGVLGPGVGETYVTLDLEGLRSGNLTRALEGGNPGGD